MKTPDKYDCILILFGYIDLGHCVKNMIIFTSLGEGAKNCLPISLHVDLCSYLCLSLSIVN